MTLFKDNYSIYCLNSPITHNNIFYSFKSNSSQIGCKSSNILTYMTHLYKYQLLGSLQLLSLSSQDSFVFIDCV